MAAKTAIEQKSLFVAAEIKQTIERLFDLSDIAAAGGYNVSTTGVY